MGFNYSSSPGPLPASVYERLHAQLSAKFSPLTLYHRDAAFTAFAERLEEKLRRTLAVPEDYHVLLLQGGATAQFAMVPLNLCAGRHAAYLHTGYWSGRALAEAEHLGCEVYCAAAIPATQTRTLPPPETWQIRNNDAYLYYVDNETVDGVEFPVPPQAQAPLVCDMSSSLLTKCVDISRYGLIFAGAQKNLGIPGLTLVLVHKERLGAPSAGIPSLYDYRLHVRSHSLYNTPVTWAWCVAEWMLDWLAAQGGVAAMQTINRRKAERVYAALDAGGLYRNDVGPVCRSHVSIVFDLTVPELQTPFLQEAAREGLEGLAGHRSRGGCRAALYNAMPEAGACALADFLTEFERRYG